jgi:hypothetical protein
MNNLREGAALPTANLLTCWVLSFSQQGSRRAAPSHFYSVGQLLPKHFKTALAALTPFRNKDRTTAPLRGFNTPSCH